MFAEKFWINEILILMAPFLLMMAVMDTTNVQKLDQQTVKNYLVSGLRGPRWRSYGLLFCEVLNTVAVAVLLGLSSSYFHDNWYQFAIPTMMNIEEKFATNMKCFYSTDEGDTRTGTCYLGSNKYLGQQIFAIMLWLWILLGASAVNVMQKMLFFCDCMKLVSLKTVCPLLNHRQAKDLVKHLGYGDMMALLDCARCIDVMEMEKICVELHKTVNEVYYKKYDDSKIPMFENLTKQLGYNNTKAFLDCAYSIDVMELEKICVDVHNNGKSDNSA